MLHGDVGPLTGRLAYRLEEVPGRRRGEDAIRARERPSAIVARDVGPGVAPGRGRPHRPSLPDQRAAATAAPGPILCLAPAGSGKTTTLVARIAWLLEQGVDPGTICTLTFNRRAAQDLSVRLEEALTPLGIEPTAVRVRTFHALGREILRSAGRPVEPLLDRAELLRELEPEAPLSGSSAWTPPSRGSSWSWRWILPGWRPRRGQRPRTGGRPGR